MIVEQFVNYKGKEYFVRADCYYQHIDDSFDHEFGTHICSHYELTSFDLVDCIDEEDKIISPDKEFFLFMRGCFYYLEY